MSLNIHKFSKPHSKRHDHKNLVIEKPQISINNFYWGKINLIQQNFLMDFFFLQNREIL